MNKVHHFGGVILAVLLAACASGSAPTEQLMRSNAAVAVAESANRQGTPEAAAYLSLARDGIALAEEQIDDDEYSDANRTLQRAQVDAELAYFLSRQAEEQQQAQAALADVEQLRSKL